MRGNFRFIASWVLALVVGGGLAARAQTFQGSLSGTATDPSGAVIPGATVKAVEVGRGLTRNAVTLSDGTYQIALLPPGRYRLEARKPGFETLAMGPINLSVNQHLKQDFRMNIGVQTTHSERVSPIISVVLIAGGIALTVAGARTRLPRK